MKLPEWYRKVWKEKMGKVLILAPIIGGPVLSGLTYLVDQPTDSWWQAWAFAWGAFPFLLLIFYWQRNTK